MIRKKTLSHTCGVPAPFAKGAKRRGQAPAAARRDRRPLRKPIGLLVGTALCGRPPTSRSTLRLAICQAHIIPWERWMSMTEGQRV